MKRKTWKYVICSACTAPHEELLRFTFHVSLLMRRALGFLIFAVCLAFPTVYPGLVIAQESQAYTCPVHPEVQSSRLGPCPKCARTLIVQPPAPKEPNADAYLCPMDPEIRASAPGKCSKCGMALVPAGPATTGAYDLTLECSPAAVKPNQKVRLRFAVFNPKTGEQVKYFHVVHEQLFHLFIVSQDMAHFQHIHPTLEADGRFTIDTVLPEAGHYKVYADFYPTDGTPQVLQRDLVTAGYRGDLFAEQAHLTPDSVLTKTVDGIKVELKLGPAEPIAGKPLTLHYHLTDETTGQPVRDVTPYLGAWGHTIILSEDQSDYVHSHPSEIVPDTAERPQVKGGPDITFEALLPRPSPYRIWTQFQRGAILTTISFTIQATRLH